MRATQGLTLHEEGVVRVAGGVLLRLEQCVKVPERALNVVVGGHFAEAKLEKDLAVLGADLEQRVQVPAIGWLAETVEI